MRLAMPAERDLIEYLRDARVYIAVVCGQRRTRDLNSPLFSLRCARLDRYSRRHTELCWNTSMCVLCTNVVFVDTCTSCRSLRHHGSLYLRGFASNACRPHSDVGGVQTFLLCLCLLCSFSSSSSRIHRLVDLVEVHHDTQES